ncbi:MAG: GIY-YIG nuclease family protein [Sediminibacterium sp.]
MSFIVYVLYSDIAEKHYTGFTANLIERLKSHNELGKEWTARYRPWRLIFQKDFAAKLDAMHYEKWLKSGQRRAFITTLPH